MRFDEYLVTHAIAPAAVDPFAGYLVDVGLPGTVAIMAGDVAHRAGDLASGLATKIGSLF